MPENFIKSTLPINQTFFGLALTFDWSDSYHNTK